MNIKEIGLFIAENWPLFSIALLGLYTSYSYIRPEREELKAIVQSDPTATIEVEEV